MYVTDMIPNLNHRNLCALQLDARKRGPPSPRTSPTSKKCKTSAENKIHSILEGVEPEITCPMCVPLLYLPAKMMSQNSHVAGLLSCEYSIVYRQFRYLFLFRVAVHVCNPCGHSCCGECAQEWISQHVRHSIF